MRRLPSWRIGSQRSWEYGFESGSATLWLLIAVAALAPLLVMITTFVIVSAAQQQLRQVANVAALSGAESLQVPGAGCRTAKATIERAEGPWHIKMTDCHIDSAGSGSLVVTLTSSPPAELPHLIRHLLPAAITASARAGWVA